MDFIPVNEPLNLGDVLKYLNNSACRSEDQKIRGLERKTTGSHLKY